MITNDQIEKAAAAYVNDEDGNNPHSFIQYPAFYEGAKWARDQQKLKTLEWNSVAYASDGGSHVIAASISFGFYAVTFHYGSNTYTWSYNDGKEHPCDDFDHGKQLAQADYEKRVNELYI